MEAYSKASHHAGLWGGRAKEEESKRSRPNAVRQKTGKWLLTWRTLESLEPKSIRRQRAGSQKKEQSHLRILERPRNCDRSENGYRWWLSTSGGRRAGQGRMLKLCTRRSQISGALPPPGIAKQPSHMEMHVSKTARSAYYVPGIALGTVAKEMNKTQKPQPSDSLYIGERQQAPTNK